MVLECRSWPQYTVEDSETSLWNSGYYWIQDKSLSKGDECDKIVSEWSRRTADHGEDWMSYYWRCLCIQAHIWGAASIYLWCTKCCYEWIHSGWDAKEAKLDSSAPIEQSSSVQTPSQKPCQQHTVLPNMSFTGCNNVAINLGSGTSVADTLEQHSYSCISCILFS